MKTNETNPVEVTLLGQSDASQVASLIADKHLDYLFAWEPGYYRAMTRDGGDMGFVMCSSAVAHLVNRCIASRA